MTAPYEPTSDMRQMARGLWDIFQALTLAGFDERQALAIVGSVIAAGAQRGQGTT